jgi:hypothetical protein
MPPPETMPSGMAQSAQRHLACDHSDRKGCPARAILPILGGKMRGNVFSNSGNKLAISSSFNGKEMDLAHFKKWVRMSGKISKGHFVFIPLEDQRWGTPQREFSLWGDEVQESIQYFSWVDNSPDWDCFD